MQKSRPKVRISRAMNMPITPKASRIMEKRPSLPGQHGSERKKNPSVYKTQLLEKQRLKFTYNISEKQLKAYFKKTTHSHKSTGSVLLGLIEMRADVAVFRLGFAKTIYAARQYVTHGHFMINNVRIFTPSHNIKVGAEIAVTEKSKNHPQILASLTESQDQPIPKYYSVNKVQMSGTLNQIPERELVPVPVNEQLIVEYYSR